MATLTEQYQAQYQNRVTVASNVTDSLVALIFGDPSKEPPDHVTFTPEQARGIGRALLAEADKAEGK